MDCGSLKTRGPGSEDVGCVMHVMDRCCGSIACLGFGMGVSTRDENVRCSLRAVVCVGGDAHRAGDQLYNDGVWKAPALSTWTALDSRCARPGNNFKPSMPWAACVAQPVVGGRSTDMAWSTFTVALGREKGGGPTKLLHFRLPSYRSAHPLICRQVPRPNKDVLGGYISK
jgi:hypothetical protein